MKTIDLKTCGLVAENYTLETFFAWFPELCSHYFPNELNHSIMYISTTENTRKEIYNHSFVSSGFISFNKLSLLSFNNFIDYFKETWCSWYVENTLESNEIMLYTETETYKISL
jgi:hypothetical protein